MEKIKKSFTKAFLPLLIASFILIIFDLLEGRACGGVWLLFVEARKLSNPNVIIIGYSQFEYFIMYGIQYLVEFIFAMVKGPFVCGIYSFCFARLNDEKPNIGKIFYFYKSFKRIIMSVVSIGVLKIFSDIQITFRSLQLTHTTEYTPTPAIYTVLFVLSTLLYIAAVLFLYFWHLAYAKNPESGLISALKKSCSCILVSIPTLIIFSALYFICSKIRLSTSSRWDYLIICIYSALRSWIGFTVYYMAISGGVNLKIFEKTFQKINEKDVEAAKTVVYNIGGNYVYTANTLAETDGSEEENNK